MSGKQVQRRRGTTEEILAHVGKGKTGELIVNTETKRIHVMDGIVDGGHPQATVADLVSIRNSVDNLTGSLNTLVTDILPKKLEEGFFTTAEGIQLANILPEIKSGKDGIATLQGTLATLSQQLEALENAGYTTLADVEADFRDAQNGWFLKEFVKPVETVGTDGIETTYVPLESFADFKMMVERACAGGAAVDQIALQVEELEGKVTALETDKLNKADYVKVEPATVNQWVEDGSLNVVKPAELANIYTKTETDTAISTAIAQAEIGGGGDVDLEAALAPYAKTTDVDTKLTGKADKTQLTGLATQTYVDNKVAAIVVPDVSGFATKQELSTAVADKTTKTYVDNKFVGMASEGYVNTKIAEAQLSGGGEVDLSGLATKEELTTATTDMVKTADLTPYAKTADVRTKAVKIVESDLDSAVTTKLNKVGITKAEADAAYQAKGDYALKSELPSTQGLATETYVDQKVAEVSAPDLTAYAKTAEIETTYAKKTDVPDVSGLATKQELTTATSDKLTKTQADGLYQAKGTYLTAVPAEYVNETELSTILDDYRDNDTPIAEADLDPALATKINNAGSGTGGGGTSDHSALTNLNTDEYMHITKTEYDLLYNVAEGTAYLTGFHPKIKRFWEVVYPYGSVGEQLSFFTNGEITELPHAALYGSEYTGTDVTFACFFLSAAGNKIEDKALGFGAVGIQGVSTGTSMKEGLSTASDPLLYAVYTDKFGTTETHVNDIGFLGYSGGSVMSHSTIVRLVEFVEPQNLEDWINPQT